MYLGLALLFSVRKYKNFENDLSLPSTMVRPFYNAIKLMIAEEKLFIF